MLTKFTKYCNSQIAIFVIIFELHSPSTLSIKKKKKSPSTLKILNYLLYLHLSPIVNGEWLDGYPLPHICVQLSIIRELKLIKSRMEGCLLEGFKVGRVEVSVYHLQYADDTLILCSSSQEQIWMLRCVLWCFEAVTGLRMNFGNSLIIGVGNVPNIETLAADLGYNVGHHPISYFGASFKSKDAWGLVVDRVRKKLVGWRA